MLIIKGLSFKHKNAKEDVLKNINLSIESYKLTVILGPNGSGKSTLFKCIVGIWKPYTGHIRVLDKKINNLSCSHRAKIFSIVPQEHLATFPYSVFDIVITGRTPYVNMFSSPSQKDYHEVESALTILGIYHLKNKPYNKISGGEKQLVLIARALVQSTPFILLDEPVSHLDFKNQINVLTKIKKLAYSKKITVLVTLHDPNLASLFADNIVVIKNGKVIANGPSKEVFNKELIEKVYGLEIDIIKNNGVKLICPILSM